MKKSLQSRLNASLDKALAPPRQKPRQNLDALLDEYDDGRTPPQSAPPVNQPPVEAPPVQSAPPVKELPAEKPPAQSAPTTPGPSAAPPPEKHPLPIGTLLPPNAPHLRLPYVTLDRIRQLRSGPRAVFEEIYRAAAGWHSDECVISVAKLGIYCRMEEKYVRKYIAELQSLGYVERLGEVLGGRDFDARGVRFRVLLPRMGKATPSQKAGGANQPPNKEKELKEQSKGESAAPKDCPDCQGLGVVYPEGYEKGAKICRHENLAPNDRPRV